MRHVLAALSVLLLAIGLFVLALTNAEERIVALLCILISAVLLVGSAVLSALRVLGDRITGKDSTKPDPHRYPPTM